MILWSIGWPNKRKHYGIYSESLMIPICGVVKINDIKPRVGGAWLLFLGCENGGVNGKKRGVKGLQSGACSKKGAD